MLTAEAFQEFAQELAELNGLTQEVALLYASHIGDTPEMDEDGLVVVRADSDEILARVKMPEEPDEFDEYFQCVKTAQGWEYQVAVVGWGGHEPELRWKTYRRWRSQPSAGRLARARDSALANPRLFRTCQRCEEVSNAGHMHDQETCQSCAERHLGVVH